MVDDLLKEAEEKYRRARQYLQAGSPERALLGFHDGLENLLRWALIRDGAAPDRAMNPDEVGWQELISYLDARHGVERQACIFLSQMTHLAAQAQAGQHPQLPTLTMQGYEKLVTQLFRRFFPATAEERQEVATRALFARRVPVGDMTAMPPERQHDTPIMVPVPPPPAPPAAIAAAARPATDSRPAWVEQLLRTNELAPAPAPVRPVAPPPAPPFAPPESAPADTTAQPVADAPPLANRAVEAGQRLRALRANGLDYCPHCRNEVPLASTTCPHCNITLARPRGTPASPTPRKAGLLDRLRGRG